MMKIYRVRSLLNLKIYYNVEMPFCLVSPRKEKKKGFYSIIQIASILLLAKKNNDNKMREKNI